ncbi:MAG: hypothetical protein ACYC24_10260 [Desulfobacteria bacterium]
MAGPKRIVPMVAVAVFLFGVVSVASGVANAAARSTVVVGIVEYARGNVVTVGRKTYDLKGARFQDGHGMPLEHPSDLRGKTLEILFRNGRIETVTVYRTLPQ